MRHTGLADAIAVACCFRDVPTPCGLLTRQWPIRHDSIQSTAQPSIWPTVGTFC